VQAATKDRGKPETNADPDQHEVIRAAGRADGSFGHRGQVHIILDGHRSPEVVPQGGEHPLMPGGQVDRQPQVARARIEHARRTDHARAQRLRRATAAPQAVRIAPRTRSTGFAAPFGSTEISVTTRPVTSATPAPGLRRRHR